MDLGCFPEFETFTSGTVFHVALTMVMLIVTVAVAAARDDYSSNSALAAASMQYSYRSQQQQQRDFGSFKLRDTSWFSCWSFEGRDPGMSCSNNFHGWSPAFAKESGLHLLRFCTSQASKVFQTTPFGSNPFPPSSLSKARRGNVRPVHWGAIASWSIC